MLRLVAYAPNGVQRFPLGSGELVIGSSEECDICLPFTGIAKRHALIRREGVGAEIEDLGSRRLTLLNGERIRRARLKVLDEVRLGKVTLLLEDVLPPEPEPPRPVEAAASVGTPDADRLLSHIAHIADWVTLDTESRRTIESLLVDLLTELGGGACFLYEGEAVQGVDFVSTLGTRFAAVTEAAYLETAADLLPTIWEQGELVSGADDVRTVEWSRARTWVFLRRFEVLDRHYLVLFALPRFEAADKAMEQGLSVIADLLVLGLIHHVGRFEPILPGHAGSRELTLAPGLVLGTAVASETLLRELRAIAAAPTNALLVGEPGSGRELCARTLHLSDGSGEEPFVVATCDGASAAQISADLFGAEIRGREGPVRREPRLAAAHGGTLYLEAVDKLPLELQGRLVRVLRTGRLEGPGDDEMHEADFRLIAATSSGLDALVAEGAFRVDLAYRLSEVTLQVPSLRERIEDVPLLLQTAINRASHDTGRRVRGITVQALQALSRYHYPGNLRELENIVRQMVLSARNGEPLDENLLPPEVRSPRALPMRRPEAGSDLDLHRLVSACEADAIREALRRTEGNKSQAAKLLGLSRNGLAKKISRLGLGD